MHNQNLSADLRCRGNFPYEECPTFLNILITMIKEKHFERDVNVKVIRNLLKQCVDSNFTTREECFAEVFINHLKK